MKIQSTSQPEGPAGKPLIQDPVFVMMVNPVFYVTERGPTQSTHPILCGRAFATTVLETMESVLESGGWSIAHVGVYNPRQARHKNGSPIKPIRWSNHAYGEAMDFKGLVDVDSKLVSIRDMKKKYPDILDNLLESCKKSIIAQGRRPEIVDEGGWIHIGLWPKS